MAHQKQGRAAVKRSDTATPQKKAGTGVGKVAKKNAIDKKRKAVDKNGAFAGVQASPEITFSQNQAIEALPFTGPKALGKGGAGDGHKRLVIIGAGASGMAAALAAVQAAPDWQILLLERQDRVGKKLLATGNGRCNLSHDPITPQNYVSASPQALASMLAASPAGEVPAFFAGLGLLCTEQNGGIYPYCMQAAMVLDVLRCALQRTQVEIDCTAFAQAIQSTQDGFLVTVNGQPLAAAAVILAAGGAAAPKLGAGQSGYQLAGSLGHTLVPLYPALVPLRCDQPCLPGLKGVRTHAAASLFCGGQLLHRDIGEVQFAEYGLSGIPIFQLSLRMSVRDATEYTVALDLLPQLSQPALLELLRARRFAAGSETLENFLLGMLNKKLGFALLKSAGLAPLSRPGALLKDSELCALAATLKEWRFPVLGTAGWEAAQVTGGGVSLTEVEPQTCGSRLYRGLYVVGEVLDAAGECGGYNLDWAFSTGLRAGRAAVTQ